MKKSAVGMVLVCILVGAVAVVAGDTIQISIKASPHVIVKRSSADRLTVHTNIAFGSVVRASVELAVRPSGGTLSPLSTFADDRGNLVAKFDLRAVKGMVASPSAALTLSGDTTSGARFEGTETVEVKDH